MNQLLISAVEAALQASNISYSRQVTGGADWGVAGAWRLRSRDTVVLGPHALFLVADADSELFSLVWRRAGDAEGCWLFQTVYESSDLTAVLSRVYSYSAPRVDSEEWFAA